MRLISSGPITGPDAKGAGVGMILLCAPLLTHESCRISITHIPTFRKQCNLSPRYTASAFHTIHSIFFHADCGFQLQKVVPLDMDKNDRNNPVLQVQFCNVNKTQLHWNSQSSSEFLLCANSQYCSPVSFTQCSPGTIFRNFGICSDRDGFFVTLRQTHILCRVLSAWVHKMSKGNIG